MEGQFNLIPDFNNYTSRDFNSSIGPALPPATLPSPQVSDDQPFDTILRDIRAAGYATFGTFLLDIFRSTTSDGVAVKRSRAHAQAISSFLGGRTSAHASELVQLMYSHRDSRPRDNRDDDDEPGAREGIHEWSLKLVERDLERESRRLVSKQGGLRLLSSLTWDAIQSFSLDSIKETIEHAAPTSLRLLYTLAVCKRKRDALSREDDPPPQDPPLSAPSPVPVHPVPSEPPAEAQEASMNEQEPASSAATQPSPSGKGKNRRDPWVIILVAFMMLLNARNLQFTPFQKLIGVWLYANGAAREIFDVLGRLGLSVAYTTTLIVLEDLTKAAQAKVRGYASCGAFMLIYDNINRMQRVWDPELGQKDTMESGTAATLVVLEDGYNFEKAFNLNVLREAQQQERRKNLDVQVLRRRIDWSHLYAVMAVHTACLLVQMVPSLFHHQNALNSLLRTRFAKRRMRKGRRTTVLPLETSTYEEGSASGNQKVLDDITLTQLGLTREQASRLLMLIGGDQSTVEKVRTLKKLLASCPHGYNRYEWVLPIIQLWHMGWADLERILETHWGSSTSDASSLAFMNEHFARKVKNVKRPDFYPAQALVFDTLRCEILDCWREYLQTDNLISHFDSSDAQDVSLDKLLKWATEIVARYMSAESYESALLGYNGHDFPIGLPWPEPHRVAEFEGDQILANSILRMRDSIFHYEFQSAVADGDIGRVMNIMNVWTFTFCGSGRNKYTNELLELTCNFEYEFNEELMAIIMDHWLCNLTGNEGSWFPNDLLQEHNNRQLKAMTGKRTAPFGDNHFKRIISYNIRYFLDAKQSMRTAMGLGRKGGVHTKKKKSIAMKRVADIIHDRQLHRFRAGRTLGNQARDDFSRGFDTFTSTSRIKDFVQRTLRDRTDLHGDDIEDVVMDDDSEERDECDEEDVVNSAPLPNMWHEGVLIQGDEVEAGWYDADEDENDGEDEL